MRSLYEVWISLLVMKTRHWLNVPAETKIDSTGSIKLIRCFSSITTYLKETSIGDNHLKEDKNFENDDPTLLSSFHTFIQYLQSSSLSTRIQRSILSDLTNIGFTNSDELIEFSRDFVDRPESLSKILQTDFGFNPLRSHQVRSTLMRMVKDSTAKLQQQQQAHDNKGVEIIHPTHSSFNLNSVSVTSPIHLSTTNTNSTHNNSQEGRAVAPLFKAVVVNKKAKMRHERRQQEPFITSLDCTEKENSLPRNHLGRGQTYNYGIHLDNQLSPTLTKELQDFFNFMTQPQTHSQEPPIRPSTAHVYIRHAKLFIGWWIHQHQKQQATDDIHTNAPKTLNTITLSLQDIFPRSDASSADPIIAFILWLRQERSISHSYEANMLRGLTKMMKFRFVHESHADPTYGEKTFQDIPLIKELRKLHREANKKQALSPRSSDEGMKWITWLEYLSVVKALKEDLTIEIQLYNNQLQQKMNTDNKLLVVTPTQQRRIATKYQYYLIVAIFSCVPDRQRTIRELELGRTLYRDNHVGNWIIKHGPDDYKTGGTYGDRPPLVLAPELTSSMDDFLQNWRCYLNPTGSHFFAQVRTGQPLTQDSVYSIVARSCYKYTGKKTNPHLLRDMIVTHIRNSQASEKELEALALYMGHSISMQRTSYDRRTMQQKVAPAIDLLRSVNHLGDTKL